jgi:hypothetical protein
VCAAEIDAQIVAAEVNVKALREELDNAELGRRH